MDELVAFVFIKIISKLHFYELLMRKQKDGDGPSREMAC